MSPIVEAGVVGAGAAVLASLLTGIVALGITRLQVRSAELVTREQFLSHRQADTYVQVCNQVSRVEAWTNVAEQTAQGLPSDLERPQLLGGDAWFEMNGRLRVFGSRSARDEFDSMMEAARSLWNLERAASQGQPSTEADVVKTAAMVRLHAARLRTVVTAEVGPLRDILRETARHWWQFSKRKRDRQRLGALNRSANRSQGAAGL